MSTLNVLERLREIDACLEKAQRGQSIQLPVARSKIATLRDDVVSSNSPQRRSLIVAVNNAFSAGDAESKVTLSRAEWELITA
jgi:hypothetical protein